ncbi:protein FATTY ACID EXPORT 2, chloroplastic-like isoform X1 [Durio zibethinus]|uniref:Protein FATTY ACID EXPORT 2, chloroplastic-like isoform X1 n=1 Tax=Durio zibethinus TaxID=66656 RepID=A0A6P5ZQQ4_DURZI|nr:protein FATTY ACID EXPORT 2, chloroplastic-like isoform X1 [Durio zibethinus]
MGKENRNKASETKENIRKRMANLMVSVSLSSPLQLQPKLGSFQRLQLFNNNGYSRFAVVGNRQLHLKGVTVAGVVSPDSKAPTIVTNTVDSANGGIEVEVDTGNGGGDKFDDRSGGGGGGGGDNSGGGDSGKKGEGEFSDNGGKKNMALSMSQKLTIGYAALVGVGGVMGYMKSGSQKSLLAGGLSAALLYYVYTELPTRPVFASSLGLGVSAVLLVVMGSRFKRSRKIFPAGVVSLMSLVMTGGYLHGIMRSLH